MPFHFQPLLKNSCGMLVQPADQVTGHLAQDWMGHADLC